MAIDANDVQGVVANAKDDTLFYGVSATSTESELVVDLSQTGSDWTAGTTWIYVASPGPGNVQHPVAVEFSVELNNGHVGYLFWHDSGGASWGIRIGAGGILGFYQDNALVGSTVTLPGIAAGAKLYHIAFSSEANPYTTGASDAYRGELRALCIDDDSYDQVVLRFAARTAGAGATVFMAQTTAGTGTLGATAPYYLARFGQGRFHPSTETIEDLRQRTDDPGVAAQTTIEFPVVDPACDLEDAGQFAGPVYQMAAAAVRNGHLRQISPLVNDHYYSQASIQAFNNGTGEPLSPIPPPWQLPAPDTDYTFLGNYLYKKLCPSSQNVNEVKIRLHCQMWRTSGATNDRLHFRLYSLNKSPGVNGFAIGNEETLDYDYCEADVATSHGSGTTGGEWLDLGRAVIKKNASNYTWLALAVYVEDLSGDLNAQLFKIRALSIEPERVVYEAGVPGSP